eukprot:scaffold55323_cov23-Tisochrysis_lutea.AAC.1
MDAGRDGDGRRWGGGKVIDGCDCLLLWVCSMISDVHRKHALIIGGNVNLDTTVGGVPALCAAALGPPVVECCHEQQRAVFKGWLRYVCMCTCA